MCIKKCNQVSISRVGRYLMKTYRKFMGWTAPRLTHWYQRPQITSLGILGLNIEAMVMIETLITYLLFDYLI